MNTQITSILGHTFDSVKASRTRLVFESSCRRVVFDHDQDCCEDVRIEDICGDLSDLEGTPILLAEESSSDVSGQDDMDDLAVWTFYKFRTAKGDVTVRWLGESNGYYSVGVEMTVTEKEGGV